MVISITEQFSADVLRFNPPNFSEDVLHAFLKDQYGITGSFKHLAGERDQNIRVETVDGTRYVLKIAGPDERDETVDFQIKALLHLAQKDPRLVVPRQIKNNSGSQSSCLNDEKGRPHWVRLVSYIEGEPMSEYDHLELDAIREIGRIAGQLCTALRGFNHPAAGQFMPWDSLNGLIFSEELRNNYLPDNFKVLAEKHLLRLKTDSVPRLLALPHQIIHHDAHTGNVMCEPGNPTHITGIIDFGDLIYRPVIMDIAVSLASALGHNPDILSTTSAMLDGYRNHLPLPEEQLEQLYDALCTAYIMSVQLLNYRAKHHTDDPEKIRQENFAGALENARRFLEFDQTIFTDHIMKSQ